MEGQIQSLRKDRMGFKLGEAWYNLPAPDKSLQSKAFVSFEYQEGVDGQGRPQKNVQGQVTMTDTSQCFKPGGGGGGAPAGGAKKSFGGGSKYSNVGAACGGAVNAAIGVLGANAESKDIIALATKIVKCGTYLKDKFEEVDGRIIEKGAPAPKPEPTPPPKPTPPPVDDFGDDGEIPF